MKNFLKMLFHKNPPQSGVIDQPSSGNLDARLGANTGVSAAPERSQASGAQLARRAVRDQLRLPPGVRPAPSPTTNDRSDNGANYPSSDSLDDNASESDHSIESSSDSGPRTPRSGNLLSTAFAIPFSPDAAPKFAHPTSQSNPVVAPNAHSSDSRDHE